MTKTEKKDIILRMKRLANRFINRNHVLEKYAGGTPDLIKKAFISAYLLAIHEHKHRNIIWHNQKENDIYDACNDWNKHSFVCIMKDNTYNIAFGNRNEEPNGDIGIDFYFEHNDDKYYIDDIVKWFEFK